MTKPHWRRFASMDALRTEGTPRDYVRALPGDWEFLPVQRAQLGAAFPSLTPAEFEASFFVCDGFCMLCASALDEVTSLCTACHNQVTRKVLP